MITPEAIPALGGLFPERLVFPQDRGQSLAVDQERGRLVPLEGSWPTGARTWCKLAGRAALLTETALADGGGSGCSGTCLQLLFYSRKVI